MSPRPPAAVTILPERSSARVIASATERSSASRSAPRSQSVRAGTGPRARRPARAASSVVRPVPGAPTRPSTGPVPASKAVNSTLISGRSTASVPQGRPSAWPSEVAVSSSAPARLRSQPYPGTPPALRRSTSASGPGVSLGVSVTARPAVSRPALSAVESTPRTAPVRGSVTGPPTAAPPERSASRPSVPRASSSASPTACSCPPSEYVAGVVPSTRASRQPWAAIRT